MRTAAAYHHTPIVLALAAIDAALETRFRHLSYALGPDADRIAALPLPSDRVRVTAARARLANVVRLVCTAWRCRAVA